jgi:hypothetical protein
MYLENNVLFGDLNLEKVKGLGVGSTIFDDAISYFGNNVEAIGGVWEVNSAYIGGISDNLVLYRNALNANKSPVEAALSTTTGKWALKHNYNKVRFSGNNSISSSSIHVFFEK